MASMDLAEFNLRTDKLSIDSLMDLLKSIRKESEQIQKKMFKKINYYNQLQKKRSIEIIQKINGA